MSRPLDAAKRQRILDAAYQAFGTVGFERATLKDIAQQAGLAPGTIYTYFADKRDLFRRAVLDTWEEFHASIEEIGRSARNYDEKLAALEEVGLELLKRVHPILHNMFSEAIRMDLFSTHLDRLCDQLEELYLQGHGKGEVTDTADYEHRRFLLRTFASGILLQLSMVEPEHLDTAISQMRRHLREDRRRWNESDRPYTAWTPARPGMGGGEL